MKLYTIKEDSHKELKDDEEVYVSDGFRDPKEIELSELDKLGFHFTPQENCASISATGLKPKIGSNAKGGLGKSAIEKTYFSRFIDGAMQIFNRTINIMGELPLQALQKDNEKNIYLMESQKSSQRAGETLSIIEAFEYARRYMDGNRYFIFNLTEPQYERQIDEEKIDSQVDSINERLDEILGISLDSRSIFTSKDEDIEPLKKEEIELLKRVVTSEISSFEDKKTMLDKFDAQEDEKAKLARKQEELKKVEEMLESEKEGVLSVLNPKTTIDGIDRLIDVLKKGENLELAEKVNKLRAALSIEIGRESRKLVSEEILGEVSQSSLVGANFTRIDYNDEAISWLDFHKHPHNCHTLVLDTDMGIEGITEPKGVKINSSDVRLLSLDGKEPSTSVDIIQFIYNNLPEERRKNFGMSVPGRKKDKVLIGKFLEYVDIYRNYKDSPSDFIKKISELQESVAQEFPKFAHKSSEEDLIKFQEEMAQERGTEMPENETEQERF